MLNALTVDVEEYFHPTEVQTAVDQSRWAALPSRVEGQLLQILELLDARRAKPTFCVGMGGRAYWDRLDPILDRWIPVPRVLHPILRTVWTPLIQVGAVCVNAHGRSAMVVPTATSNSIGLYVLLLLGYLKLLFQFATILFVCGPL